ncbi:TetR/AcrR family transcriptional regulator [Microbacterium thalli]|uniref:TetR/AcrR family transcriptional regulator n=1 Tax=Microbacterium thalli TaxID=3027921 RepID=UPI002365D466|nr:TetR family transcriptional regulator [Microbacterium thalli]MDD7930404.1 TetR family transcriptional regulator [Microbacterium thalli]
MRERILAEARRLTLQSGAVPSLNAVAAAAEVSKGGLMHHFASRSALVSGLARQALDEVDAVMADVVARGNAAETWLRLSAADADERGLLRALAGGFRPEAGEASALLADARDALARWERAIASEVGDPVRARVIRLVGDALVANAIAGVEAADGIDDLVRHLVPESGATR